MTLRRTRVVDDKRKRTIRYKGAITALAFAVAGLIAISISEALDPTKYPMWRGFLLEFGTIALVAGTLHVIYEVFQRAEYLEATERIHQDLANHANDAKEIAQLWQDKTLDEVRLMAHQLIAKVTVAEQVHKLGLAEARQDANSYNFGHLLASAKTIKIVLNDGRTWCSSNAPHLRERFKDEAKETEFFFIHPNSPFLSVLAKKDATTTDVLSRKIDETVGMIRDLCLPSSKVKVYGHYLFNPHSLFFAENFILVTPYFHSHVRRTVPLLRFDDRSDGCYFRETRDDLEALKQDAELLFPGASTVGADQTTSA
jgi:hypothetical protein